MPTRKTNQPITRPTVFGEILLLDMLLDIFNGWKLLFQFNREITGDLIFTDTNRLAHIFQRIFRDKVILAFTQKQANRWVILFPFQNAVHRREIKVQLSSILRLEITCFQFDYHIASKVQVVKQQVDIKVIAADVDARKDLSRGNFTFCSNLCLLHRFEKFLFFAN